MILMTYLFPVAINSWFMNQLPFMNRIKMIQAAGFTQTALWWTTDSPDREEFPEIVRQHGLVVESSHIEYLCADDIWSETASVRQDVVDLYITRIRECSRHQIPLIVLHACHKDGKPGPHKAGMDCFKTVIKAAEDYGLQVTIENTSNTQILDYVFSELQSPAMQYCYDSSHDQLYSADKGDLLAKYGNLLAVTHFSDNDGKEDRHWTPGHGIVDWKLIAAKFPVKTYRGALSLEIGPAEYEMDMSPEEFLRNAYQQISKIRDLIVAEYNIQR
jgi:sugar phosphate isomerase/epimerase